MFDKARISERLARIEAGLFGKSDDGSAFIVGKRGLYDRVTDLEVDRPWRIDMPCPTCGHVTLMRRDQVPGLFCPALLSDEVRYTYYCYGCGKTYRKSTETTMTEIVEE